MGTTGEVTIIISFVAGFLTFLSPCVLPLFPSYITYITGKSFEDIKAIGPSNSIRRLTAMHSLFFILGFSIVFVLLGITFAYLGSFFGIKKIWLEKVGGLFIILFGLHLLGAFRLRFLNKEKKLTYHRKEVSYFSSFFIGVAFGVGWTPCVGPILGSILVYASTFESLPRAAVLLLFYSLGLGAPFFIAGLAVNQFLYLFSRAKAFMKFVPIITGLFLILAGIMLFFGLFSRLSAVFVT